MHHQFALPFQNDWLTNDKKAKGRDFQNHKYVYYEPYIR